MIVGVVGRGRGIETVVVEGGWVGVVPPDMLSCVVTELQNTAYYYNLYPCGDDTDISEYRYNCSTQANQICK